MATKDDKAPPTRPDFLTEAIEKGTTDRQRANDAARDKAHEEVELRQKLAVWWSEHELPTIIREKTAKGLRSFEEHFQDVNDPVIFERAKVCRQLGLTVSTGRVDIDTQGGLVRLGYLKVSW